jgi:hypothetical protein
MGSWTDLRPEQVPQWNDLLSLYRQGKPFVSGLEQSQLVDLFRALGFEVMYATIEQACLNGWTKVDKVRLLAEQMKKYGVVKTKWAIERANALEFHSLDAVIGILEGRIPAYRTGKGNGAAAVPARVTKGPTYPTPEGIHGPSTVQAWMRERGHGMDRWNEFFDLAGKCETYGYQLYQLKDEYR